MAHPNPPSASSRMRAMQELCALLPGHLLLHPVAGAGESEFTPENLQYEEFCRLCTPFGLSVHLLGNPRYNAITIIIDFGGIGSPTWRVHIDHELWVRGDLARNMKGVEPLFRVHPLAWASEVHTRMLRKWGDSHGVIITARLGQSRELFVQKRPQD